MKIQKVEIHNFRTLYDVSIDFHNITTFIGPNGAGKSTILNALDWFFNSSSDDALSESDATYGHSDEDIEVKVTFNDLTSDDRASLAKYVSDNSDTFVAWKTRKDGHEGLSANYKGNPDFAAIRNCSKVAEKREKYRALREQKPDLELPAATTNTAIMSALLDWEHAHPDDLQEMPEEVTTAFNGFNSNGAIRDLFNFTLVKADYRAAEEAEDTNSSLLGSIIGRAIDRHKADEELEKLYGGITGEEQSIYQKTFSGDLQGLSQKLNRIVDQYSHGRDVEIKPMIQEIKPPKANFTIAVKEGEDETIVANQGHGFQRMLLIAALQLLAETVATDEESSQNANGVLCLAIEEPELYQHPIQAKTFARVLRSLAENPKSNVQIIYATHSPFFISEQHYDDIYRLTRHHNVSTGDTGVAITGTSKEKILRQMKKEKETSSPKSTIENRIGEVLTNSLSSVVFSNVAILVEGSTEKAVIEECADRLLNKQSQLGCEGIEVVVCNGKSNINQNAAILETLGIPCVVVFDNDSNKTPGDKGYEQCAKENSRIVTYFGLTERCGDRNWPDPGYYEDSHVLVVDKTLEPYLDTQWEGWTEELNKAVARTGKDKKDAYTYRLAVQSADISKCPGEIKSLIEDARELNRRRNL
ncbi:ATP-dependent nuclease [Bifidobacterium polysaccharolyticum]|uniref:ATP-dependent nuclease n=1 Tax=Bifidobacterium polysaccharolyticum TaxID=2750967 RepID=UPI0018DCF8BA|nr:AAA family ATPase [Bifidobacterium polysaccharolyticum]MBI0064196.1 ATP-dependent endonuclease [Bifidobacterium polysaccharolyticum]